MGLGVYPVFDKPTPGIHFDSDGKILVADLGGLDALASRDGLKPITGYGDNRAIPPEFDGDPEDLDDLLGPWDGWSPIAEGLRTIEALAQALRSDPAARSMIGQPDQVIDELDELGRCLHEASKVAALFRLKLG